jgi:hypothetical protein
MVTSIISRKVVSAASLDEIAMHEAHERDGTTEAERAQPADFSAAYCEPCFYVTSGL